MKKFLIITILTLSTTMASAKPADAFPPLIPLAYSGAAALWGFFVPTVSTVSGVSTAIVGTGTRVIVKQGAKKIAKEATNKAATNGANQTVKHSSGQLIDKSGGKYLQGTTRP